MPAGPAPPPTAHELWTLCRTLLGRLAGAYDEPAQRFTSRSGLDRSTLVMLIVVLAHEPDAVSVTELRKLSPYTSVAYFDVRLGGAAVVGYVTDAQGGYRLTDMGRAAVREARRASAAPLERTRIVAAEDATRLADLLGSVVTEAVTAPAPPDPWFARHALALTSGDDPPSARLFDTVFALDAYRSDCHRAAWEPIGVDGPTMETLSTLWQGTANSLDGICTALRVRGFPRRMYARALTELRDRGWLRGDDDGRLDLTDAGRSARDHVETVTDGFFFRPWYRLADADQREAATLLEKVARDLKAAPAPSAEPPRPPPPA